MIYAHVTKPGSEIPVCIQNTLNLHMKELMSRACEEIPFATFKDDRCEGRILTDSGGDMRPPSYVSNFNPIQFRLHSLSPCIPAGEIKIIRDAIYRQFREVLGYDFDMFIVLCD